MFATQPQHTTIITSTYCIQVARPRQSQQDYKDRYSHLQVIGAHPTLIAGGAWSHFSSSKATCDGPRSMQINWNWPSKQLTSDRSRVTSTLSKRLLTRSVMSCDCWLGVRSASVEGDGLLPSESVARKTWILKRVLGKDSVLFFQFLNLNIYIIIRFAKTPSVAPLTL